MIDEGDLHAADHVKDWIDFLKRSCKRQLGEIGREFPHKRSLFIDLRDVEKFGSTGLKLWDEVVQNPGKTIEDINDAIISGLLIKFADGKPPKMNQINVRFVGLSRKTTLRELRYENVNTLVAIDSVVIRVSEVRPRISNAAFRCPAGHFTLKAQRYGKFTEPDRCATDGCQYKRMELLPKRSTFVNQQRVKIQESGEGLRPGQQPQTMDVVVLDDICDQIYPPDRATLTGILRSIQRVVKGEKSTIFDLYLELVSIEAEERNFSEINVTQEAEDQIKEIAKSGKALEMLADSIATSIYGYQEIKRGIALQMFGGVSSFNADGTRNRGEIHILILGDPGTAKSKMIKYAANQSPRGVVVSAITSSGPGLTGTATRDEDGRWTIEAGALPMADGGVAAIDEIDKAQSDTNDHILSVAEDGEVRVTKAGQNRVLKARDSLICAGNPKDERFDPFADLSQQINIPPALLSRFDLLYLMIDSPNPKLDEERSRHVIKNRYIAECRAAGKPDRITPDDLKMVDPPVLPDLLKQYVAYAKRNITPIMNPQVREFLTQHYLKIRGTEIIDSKKGTTSPPTMRQQEALIRLAEASARIRLSPEVTLKDAEIVVTLFDSCMKAVATDPKTGQVDLGRIGQGMSQEKINMIGALREVIRNEPGISLKLIYAKMEERSFKNQDAIKKAIDKMINDRPSDLMEPKFEHYQFLR